MTTTSTPPGAGLPLCEPREVTPLARYRQVQQQLDCALAHLPVGEQDEAYGRYAEHLAAMVAFVPVPRQRVSAGQDK